MTHFALTVYRRETRAALERATGRLVTNEEQQRFITRLEVWELHKWIEAEAEREAEMIRTGKRTDVPSINYTDWRKQRAEGSQ